MFNSVYEKNCILKVKNKSFNFEVLIDGFNINSVEIGVAEFVVSRNVYDNYIENLVEFVKKRKIEFYRKLQPSMVVYEIDKYYELLYDYTNEVKLHCTILCEKNEYHLTTVYLNVEHIEKSDSYVSFFVEYGMFFKRQIEEVCSNEV